MSSIKAFASSISVHSSASFHNNTAIAGPAFILVEDSNISITENSQMYFSNNHARDIGGVFYISTKLHFYTHHSTIANNYIASQTICFLTVEGNRLHTQLSFVNNTAGKGGDAIYGGELELGWDGDLNCLLGFKNVSNVSQNTLSLISSAPSRVCLCDTSGKPDCLKIFSAIDGLVYPGQTINISAVAVGQDFGTVAGSVYAQFLHSSTHNFTSQLDMWQHTQGVLHNACNLLILLLFFRYHNHPMLFSF